MFDYFEKTDFVCAKCKAENNEGATFCFNCGYELDSNYCPNSGCDRNNGVNIQMPSNYCYCDSCGHESTYYLDGLIEPQVFDHN